MAKKAVDLHGGLIRGAGAVDAGATFEFTIDGTGA
jgi:hypothetical protein